MSADLFRSILKVSAAQILRAAGFDRARSPAVIDAFADILARYLQLLGSTSQCFAELDNREESDLEDVRAAMEKCGLLRPLDLFSDDFTRQEETAGVDAFIDWARGTKAQELRLVAGMEKQWGADFYGLAEPPTGSGFGHDWLSTLMQKQIRVGSENPFKGTVLERQLRQEAIVIEGNMEEQKTTDD